MSDRFYIQEGLAEYYWPPFHVEPEYYELADSWANLNSIGDYITYDVILKRIGSIDADAFPMALKLLWDTVTLEFDDFMEH